MVLQLGENAYRWSSRFQEQGSAQVFESFILVEEMGTAAIGM